MKRGTTVAICMVPVLLATSPGRGIAESISACGQIDRLHECLLFWRFDTPGLFVLPDSALVAAPGIYHVTGESYMSSTSCEPAVPSLREVVVEPCTPDTLGCGFLGHFTSDDGDCYCWRNLPEHHVFNVRDLGGFAVGDTVIAIGVPCPACLAVGGTCAAFGVSLFEAHFVACPDTLNPAVPETWGRVKWRYRP
jgi:hypothetical protein